jgi:hypothetical protein
VPDVPNPQRWPITPSVVIEQLSTERLERIARHFRLGGEPGASWERVREAILAEPAAHAIALLHLISRRELSDLCRRVGVDEQGPTQDVLARLLPLCPPTPTLPNAPGSPGPGGARHG